MVYLTIFAAIALAVLAFFVLSWWGGAIILVLGVGFAAYAAVARGQDRSVGTIETGARREPTGRPRAASSNTDTANERVGQNR